MHRPKRTLIAALPLVMATLAGPPAGAQEPITVENASAHPQLSPAIYEGVVRESVYITMRDGVKLAADIFRPANDGEVETDPLPLVWTHHRYVRAQQMGENRIDMMRMPPIFGTREFVRHGYIVAAVDTRGGGASFGTYQGPFNPTETDDAREIIEWFAAQPWCDGNIGMYGGSYLGGTQYMAAATSTPHLKAIIPSVAPGDLYAFAYAGGIYRDEFMRAWTDLTQMLDTQAPVAPVDADEDGAMLADARADHDANRDTDEQWRQVPYRNSLDPVLGIELNTVTSPMWHLDAIEESGVAIYHLAGWMDVFVRDQLVMFANLDNPQRIAIGPWFHQQRHEFDNVGEHLRWYDRYLKGIDNGIDNEPPVHYYVMGAEEGEGWRTAEQWPLPDERRTLYHFHARAADRTDGLLSREAPKPNPGHIEYTVDYTTTTGASNRWRNAHGGPGEYPDLSPNDEKGINFTTAALGRDVQVTGHPVVALWVESTADDGDFFVYLEEVDAEGVSHYVTEGSLRASHRARNKPPFDYLGLPFHRSFERDIEPLTEEPVLLEFDLLPTANIFDEGHRIRVTITCADADNQATPVLDPAPVVTLHCAPERASSIILPIIPTDVN